MQGGRELVKSVLSRVERLAQICCIGVVLLGMLSQGSGKNRGPLLQAARSKKYSPCFVIGIPKGFPKVCDG